MAHGVCVLFLMIWGVYKCKYQFLQRLRATDLSKSTFKAPTQINLERSTRGRSRAHVILFDPGARLQRPRKTATRVGCEKCRQNSQPPRSPLTALAPSLI